MFYNNINNSIEHFILINRDLYFLCMQ
jgi:hypothetical protein